MKLRDFFLSSLTLPRQIYYSHVNPNLMLLNSHSRSGPLSFLFGLGFIYHLTLSPFNTNVTLFHMFPFLLSLSLSLSHISSLTLSPQRLFISYTSLSPILLFSLFIRYPVKSFCAPSFHLLLHCFLFINFKNSSLSSILYLSLSTSITIYQSKLLAAHDGEYLISGTPPPSLSLSPIFFIICCGCNYQKFLLIA